MKLNVPQPLQGAAPSGAALYLLLALLMFVLPLLSACGAASVSLVGRLDGLRADRLALAGSLVYIADRSSLHIVDAADPANPVLLGSLATPGRLDALAADGRRAYLSLHLAEGAGESEVTRRWIAEGLIDSSARSGSGGRLRGASYLVIVDAGDPAEPQVVGAIDTTPPDGRYQQIRQIALAGGYAYLVSENSEALVVDVSVSSNPRQAGLVAPLASHVTLSGSLLYAAAGGSSDDGSPGGNQYLPGGLQIFDITDIEDPVLLGVLEGEVLGGDATLVLRSGTLVYLALSAAEGSSTEHYLVTLDVSDPARPREVHRYRAQHAIERLERTASRVFLLRGGRVTVLDIANADAPAAVAEYDLQSALNLSTVAEVTIDGFLAYIAAGDDGLLIARLEQ